MHAHLAMPQISIVGSRLRICVYHARQAECRQTEYYAAEWARVRRMHLAHRFSLIDADRLPSWFPCIILLPKRMQSKMVFMIMNVIFGKAIAGPEMEKKRKGSEPFYSWVKTRVRPSATCELWDRTFLPLCCFRCCYAVNIFGAFSRHWLGWFCTTHCLSVSTRVRVTHSLALARCSCSLCTDVVCVCALNTSGWCCYDSVRRPIIARNFVLFSLFFCWPMICCGIKWDQ